MEVDLTFQRSHEVQVYYVKYSGLWLALLIIDRCDDSVCNHMHRQHSYYTKCWTISPSVSITIERWGSWSWTEFVRTLLSPRPLNTHLHTHTERLQYGPALNTRQWSSWFRSMTDLDLKQFDINNRWLL